MYILQINFLLNDEDINMRAFRAILESADNTVAYEPGVLGYKYNTKDVDESISKKKILDQINDA